MKYIDAEKLIALLEQRKKQLAQWTDKEYANQRIDEIDCILDVDIHSLQQEQQEKNKLPSKRTRVNYAICSLQSFKHLREDIVLDDYVYDEGKCYKENLLNYIRAIPENRLTEIRSYLKEKGWWPYDDDSDWGGEQEQPEVDLEKLKNKAELIANEIMMGVQANKYHTCIYDKTSNDFNHSHLFRAALKGIKVGLNARKEE